MTRRTFEICDADACDSGYETSFDKEHLDDEWSNGKYDDEYDEDLIHDWVTSLEKTINDSDKKEIDDQSHGKEYNQ